MGEFIDLTGKTFGDWTVNEYAGDRLWVCNCRNGHTKKISSYSLRKGTQTVCRECKCKSVNIGDTFGDWTVIKLPDSNHLVRCRCSCGVEKDVNMYTLLSGTSKGCGHNKNKDRVIDLTNKRFGDLVVLRYAGKQYWECLCSCGNTVLKHRNHLIDGRATNCGHKIAVPVNLAGMKFGKLQALSYVGNKTWRCRCECGNIKDIKSANLVNGSTISCGCWIYQTTRESLINICEQYKALYGSYPGVKDIANIENVSYNIISRAIKKHGLYGSKYIQSYSSTGERELCKFIADNCEYDVRHNVKNIVGNYESDIYIPELNVAVEFNGDYWHSELNKDKKYHFNKTVAFGKKGIRLIHVFEHEWNDETQRRKIEQLILKSVNAHSNIVKHARDLTITEVENDIAKEFCEKYHLQGYASSSINIALSDKDEIVGICTFGKPRFSTEQYELIRLCYKDGYVISGGAAKMLKYFIDKYNPDNIVSYCNISKFDGNSYLKLGFKLKEITEPSYRWVNLTTGVVMSRYQTMKQSLVEKGLGQQGETESDIMQRLGYVRVYDCGNMKFVWNKQ